MTYSRPFNRGVRYHLGKRDLAILTPDQRTAHDYFFNYRNKHVAHSCNAFESNVVRANYCEERVKEEGITSISWGGRRFTGFSASDLEKLVELTNVFEPYIKVLIEKEQERLLVIVRGMPLEKVLAGGRNAFKVDAATAVSKDRKIGW